MNNYIQRTWNINKMVNIEDLHGVMYQNEAGGHTFAISAVDDNGTHYDLSGTPSAVALRADGQDVNEYCFIQDGRVICFLIPETYAVPGKVGLTVYLTDEYNMTTAIYAAVCTVAKTSSGIVAPPAGDNVITLVNQIASAVATIPASYSDLMADIAPTYSSSALYAVGQYAWYNGDLKRCIVPITTAETYTAAHWTSAVIGQDITDLKSALEEITGTGTNLFDKDNVSYVEGYIPGNAGETGAINSNTNARTVYIPCDENTTYTVSKQQATARFAIGYTKTTPTVGVSVYNVRPYSTDTAITITTGDDAQYLVAFVYLSTADTLTFAQICAMLQIQLGNTATDYEPFKTTAVDNVARNRIETLEESDAQAGKFKQIQATAVPMAANIGSALEFDISAMSGSGNVSFADGEWVFALGGTISGNIGSIVANKKYIIELGVEVQAGVDGDINTNPCTLTLGDASITFFSAADANWIIALTPTVSGTVALTVAMHENWNGKITAITVKPVNAVAGIPQKINNVPLHASANSLSFGGQNNLLFYGGSGSHNTSLGVNAQRDIDTGLWNSAVGYNAQLKLNQGKGNSALGCFAQNLLETGCYNNAFGESAQNHLTSGQWNDGFGIEAQGNATTAKNNVAFGRRSQHLLQTGNFNTSVGAWSGFNSHDVSPEGKNAVKLSSYTTLIGGGATLKSPDAGDSDYATTLGFQTKADKQGVAVGALAEADVGGIAIGFNAKAGQNEVVLGNKKLIFHEDGTVTWTEVS